MSKHYSAADLEDVRALERNRAAMEANTAKIKALCASIRGNAAYAEDCRIVAWGAVGRVTATNPNDRSTWRCPPGWPAPYRDGFNTWLEIHEPDLIRLERGHDVSPASSEEAKHLKAFREAIDK